jgi:hypothetical protein
MACLVGFHGLEQWLQFQDWGQQLSLYIKKNGPTAPRCEYIVFFDRSVSTSRKRGTLPLVCQALGTCPRFQLLCYMFLRERFFVGNMS